MFSTRRRGRRGRRRAGRGRARGRGAARRRRRPRPWARRRRNRRPERRGRAGGGFGGRFGEGEVGRRGRGVFFDTRASWLFFARGRGGRLTCTGTSAPNASYCLAALPRLGATSTCLAAGRGSLTETTCGMAACALVRVRRGLPRARRPRVGRADAVVVVVARPRRSPLSARASRGRRRRARREVVPRHRPGLRVERVRLVPVEGVVHGVAAVVGPVALEGPALVRAAAPRATPGEARTRRARRAARGGRAGRTIDALASERSAMWGGGGECGGRARGRRASFGGVAPSRFSKEIGGTSVRSPVFEL